MRERGGTLIRGRRLFDILAKRVGVYLGDDTFSGVGNYSRKHGKFVNLLYDGYTTNIMCQNCTAVIRAQLPRV